ncbi:MAG: DUF1987 domain-containing protein [Flavobacteriales bacterium]|nr:DUF1987 domain-containing protein [Flavobacteriales bacterium]
MEALNLKGMAKTPDVNFDPEKGLLKISGKSIPENASAYYAPIMHWLDTYSKEAPPQTTVNIHLEYFNSASSKSILDLLRKLSSLHETKQSEVLINWYYEEDDEDILAAGEDYETMVDVPFKMVEV